MAQGQYWFNTTTRAVEQGHQSGAKDLMGPYATHDEAAAALSTAAARTEAWDRAEADD